jgi:hypothetical protein
MGAALWVNQMPEAPPDLKATATFPGVLASGGRYWLTRNAPFANSVAGFFAAHAAENLAPGGTQAPCMTGEPAEGYCLPGHN